MRRFLIMCAGLISVILSSNPSEALVKGSVCTRNTVTTYPLWAELNRVHHCVRPIVCPGELIQVETKRIGMDGGQINQWLLASYDVSLSYTPTQQNAYIQNAKNLAILHRPASKVIVDIRFYWTTIPDLGPANYFVGANITYAKCGAPHRT